MLHQWMIVLICSLLIPLTGCGSASPPPEADSQKVADPSVIAEKVKASPPAKSAKKTDPDSTGPDSSAGSQN